LNCQIGFCPPAWPAAWFFGVGTFRGSKLFLLCFDRLFWLANWTIPFLLDLEEMGKLGPL
jgi:hypothetical protein